MHRADIGDSLRRVRRGNAEVAAENAEPSRASQSLRRQSHLCGGLHGRNVRGNGGADLTAQGLGLCLSLHGLLCCHVPIAAGVGAAGGAPSGLVAWT